MNKCIYFGDRNIGIAYSYYVNNIAIHSSTHIKLTTDVEYHPVVDNQYALIACPEILIATVSETDIQQIVHVNVCVRVFMKNVVGSGLEQRGRSAGRTRVAKRRTECDVTMHLTDHVTPYFNG